MKPAEPIDLKKAKRAYAGHKNNSGRRGIAWEFTFEQWWAIWEPYFHLRGSGKNGLCMGRFNDEGPYSPGNVYLTTKIGNGQDYHRTARAIEARRQKKEARAIAQARYGNGWKYGAQDKTSQLAYVSTHGNKSYCNIEEDDLRF